jgi:hypothetical protein
MRSHIRAEFELEVAEIAVFPGVMVGDNRNMTIRFGVRLLGMEANQPLLRYLSERYAHRKKYWTENPSCSPTELGPSPALGAEPKLVEWL